jgi:type VI secretion system protein ImpH
MENPGRSVKKAARRLKSGIGAPDFWAFVRAMENANPSGPRLGNAKNPLDENIRFGQQPYLHFPPTDIAEIIEGGRAAGVDATVILYFFGLLGVNGPMPLEFTNYVFRRSHNHFDNTWRRFLDIIHHRFLTLYYRAYAAGQQAMSFDRKDDDPLSFIIKSLAGFSPAGNAPDREEMLILKSAAQLSCPSKNRRGLEDMLRRLFRFNLAVRDFVPSSGDIPSENRALPGKKNATLGVDAQIGSKYLSITGKFEIQIGPISFDEYRSFMMSRNGARLLLEAVALYLDRPLDYSVVFTVRTYTIPVNQLGFDLEQARWDAPQLGYTCWIGAPEEKLMTLRIDAARFKARQKRTASSENPKIKACDRAESGVYA